MEANPIAGFSPAAKYHAEHPRNYGVLKDFHGNARITGPCGDTMEFWITVSEGLLKKVSFVTDGCGSSIACGSMAATLAERSRLEKAMKIEQQDILNGLGGLPKELEHCALLAANALRAACEDYLNRQKEARSENENAGAEPKRKQGESEQEYEERSKLELRLRSINRKIVVLSGKGGVGKSSVAVNLAMALAFSGKRTGLLDVDIHGPSIPTMLGIEDKTIRGGESGMLPVETEGIKVMSIGFLLQRQEDAVIWRGPRKMGVIKQFLKDVEWGELDYLIIDSPPGTGDEPLSVCQLIEDLHGAIIVTTPQKVAEVDVRKSVTFCRSLGISILGIVENMNGFVCPKCGETTEILGAGAGKRIAEDMGVPFLGSIPIDPKVAEACDSGNAFIKRYAETKTAKTMLGVINSIVGFDKPVASLKSDQPIIDRKESFMKIAIPLANGKLSLHFGHCERFALIEVEPVEKKIIRLSDIEAPPHEPGLLPSWLAERGANIIIAGGMGRRAQDLFANAGIQVVIGAESEEPEKLAAAFLSGSLKTGQNICDH